MSSVGYNYKCIWIGEKGNRRKVAIHRLVMEQYLGRPLTDKEIVHHKDDNIYNNSIENLELTTREDHLNIHGTHGKKEKVSTDPNLAWCASCQQFLPREMFTKNKYKKSGLSHYCIQCRKKRNKTDRPRSYYASIATPCDMEVIDAIR